MNTNSNLTRILCFGDSNTWGYIPATKHERYAPNIRWTGVLQDILGSNYEVIEEGLNSRTFCTNDPRPGKEGRNGLEYLIPCLDTHDPIDVLVLMLGTNELKKDYALEVNDIAEMLRRTLENVTKHATQTGQRPKIVVISPPLVDQAAEQCRQEYNYLGCSEKSRALAGVYASIASRYDALFLDAQSCTEAGADGVHITMASHKKLGEALAALM